MASGSTVAVPSSEVSLFIEASPVVRQRTLPIASLAAAEDCLAEYAYFTTEPWEPINGDVSRLSAPVTRRLQAVR